MTSAPADAGRLVEEVVNAHGGLQAWRRHDALEVSFSSGGLAFASKGQARTLRGLTGVFATTSQDITLAGTEPEPWHLAVRDHEELVGRLRRLRTQRHRLHWSTADVATFAASAMWTYLSIPFLLLDPQVGLEVRPATDDGTRRLTARFPADMPTHCPEQVLHIDHAGIIRRHDYTALAFGRWARASQSLSEHGWYHGLLIPTRRTVTPRLVARPAGWPTLVWISIHDVRPAARNHVRTPDHELALY